MKHYVYRITNTQLNKHYYGSRTTINKLPNEDIGYIYFSSSSDKKFIKDQKENPQDYKYKVIRIFSTRKEAISMEIMLHDKFDVGVNESFYNKASQTSTGFDTTGTKLSEETKNKISKSNKGRTLSEETRLKMSKAQSGKTIAIESINKMVRTRNTNNSYKGQNKGRVLSEETKNKISRSNKGRTFSEEFKNNCSKRSKGSGNPRALKYLIYDDNNDLIYEFDTGYEDKLKKLNISSYIFKKALKSGEKIKYVKGMKKDNLKYVGWYIKSQSIDNI